MTKRKKITLDFHEDGSQVQGFLSGPEIREAKGRIVSVKLSDVCPDFFQPRPILPADIKARFFKEQINCYEAAEQWLALGEDNPAEKSRLETLLKLGETIGEYGQIKPITGQWQVQGKERIFLLETGERRFWGVVLSDVKGRRPQIETRISAIEVQERSRARQVIENAHMEPPTAIGRAREIASLVLNHMGQHPDANMATEYDYFTLATKVKRFPEGMWPQISDITGLNRRTMGRLLALLEMDIEALYLADLHYIPERVLREIRKLPKSEQAEAIKTAAATNATHEDAALMVAESKGEKRPPAAPVVKAARRMKSFAQLALRQDVWDDLGGVATEIVGSTRDKEDLIRFVDVLTQLAREIEIRIDSDYED